MYCVEICWYKNWYKAILIARALYIDDKMK